jgi:hypothetical protein
VPRPQSDLTALDNEASADQAILKDLEKRAELIGALRNRLAESLKVARHHEGLFAVRKQAEEYERSLEAVSNFLRLLYRTYENANEQASTVAKLGKQQAAYQSALESYRGLQDAIRHQADLVSAVHAPADQYAALLKDVRRVYSSLEEQEEKVQSATRAGHVQQIAANTQRLRDDLLDLNKILARYKSAAGRSPFRELGSWTSLLGHVSARLEAEKEAESILLEALQTQESMSPGEAVDVVVSRLPENAGMAADAARRALWRLVDEGRIVFTDDRRLRLASRE